MRVKILYDFKEGPWGGANQFLQAIRKIFIKNSYYTNEIEEADIVLFNANPEGVKYLRIIHKQKLKNPNLIIIMRIDGPLSLMRDNGLLYDQLFYRVARHYIDGIVYQSIYSMEQNKNIGMAGCRHEMNVINAPNSDIFNKNGRKSLFEKEKTSLLATTWSDNEKKGFSVYKWLDENLDFSQYEMKIIGKSPIKFKNIKHVEPLESIELANQLKCSDIFITASQKDPCSNSLIEAIHCGLAAVALRDGGHPEIVGDAGELFEKADEIPGILERIRSNKNINKNHHLPDIDAVSDKYLFYFKSILRSVSMGEYKPIKPNITSYLSVMIPLILWKIGNKYLKSNNH
jgi:glycosyltransferase involved in cell wall biosynthesis